jgi:DNA-binding CsgD family transcriptional regulator
MQEALLHLWRIERERPGQRISWYLQSCRFRLQHYLVTGRSVDSAKRRAAQVPMAEEDSDATISIDHLAVQYSELNRTSARDIVSSIAPRLKPKELAVLYCLSDGLNTSDIVRSLNLSAPTVTKYRRKIAAVAAELGFTDAGILTDRAVSSSHRPRRLGC